VILLDTNALIWVDTGHQRVRTLLRRRNPLYVSPASILELQFLSEAGRIRLKSDTLEWVLEDDRWSVDEPPAISWFLRAVEVAWTRDPFDRLLAAHARLRRWRLATADANLLEHLGPTGSIEL
jgi:PIN domain nuclease of toxin-antitoxin system